MEQQFGDATASHGSSLFQGNINGVHGDINIFPPASNQKDERCLADLRGSGGLGTDPRDDKTRIAEAKGGLLKDSYRWILDNEGFVKWRTDPQCRLLWIKGDAGKGKTMLMCGIINDMTQLGVKHFSYFFCQTTSPALNNATAVLRGLIYVLVDEDPSLLKHVRKKYDHAGALLFQDQNAWAALTGIMKSMLASPNLSNAVLAVDALDECSHGLPGLLTFIEQASSEFPAKWILTSRNWPSIEAALAGAENTLKLSLELNEGVVSAAVGAFISHQVALLERRKKCNQETRRAVEDYLTANSHGTFLWVALVCERLVDPNALGGLTLATLQSYPPGIDPLYTRMMNQISASDSSALLMQVLSVALMAYRPVSLPELSSLVEPLGGFSNGELEQVVESCGSFLNHGRETVNFVHQSAKDFLLKQAQFSPERVQEQHYAIFLRSLTVLSSRLRRDMYNLSNLGFDIEHVSIPEPNPLASLRYCCLFWVDHLDDSRLKENRLRHNHASAGNNILQFIKKTFLYWLEALSLMRSIPEGLRAMRKLHDTWGSNGPPNIVAYIHDAYRFILSHYRGIEIAPLQVYASALIFSPEQSLTKVAFKTEVPKWGFSKSIAGKSWGKCLITLEGHTDVVNSVTSLENGQLASCSADSTIKIWDSATGRCIHTLSGHYGPVERVALSLDCKLLASSSSDSTVKIWDLDAGACIRTLDVAIQEPFTSAAFSPDGKTLIISMQGEVQIWNPAEGTCISRITTKSKSKPQTALSHDGKLLAIMTSDRLQILDPVDGTCLRTVSHLSNYQTFDNLLSFSKDGRMLAPSTIAGYVDIWNPTAGIRLHTIRFGSHIDNIISLAFSPNCQYILCSMKMWGSVQAWDLATGKFLDPISTFDFQIATLFSSSADSQCVATFSKKAKAFVCKRLTCDVEPEIFDGHTDSITGVVFLADGRRLVSSSADTTIKIWDLEVHDDPQTHYSKASLRKLMVSADKKWLIAAFHDSIEIWDQSTGKFHREISDQWHEIAFSTDSLWLVTIYKTLSFWDPVTGSCNVLIPRFFDRSEVMFSPDNQRLACIHNRGLERQVSVEIWDMHEPNKEPLVLCDFKDDIYVICFLMNGQHVATGSRRGGATCLNTVIIWDAITGACLHMIENYSCTLEPWSIKFSHDCQIFAYSNRHVKGGALYRRFSFNDYFYVNCDFPSGLHDSGSLDSSFSLDSDYPHSLTYSVRVRNLSTGMHLQTIDMERQPLSIVLSADGSRLACTTETSQECSEITVWDTASGNCVWAHLIKQLRPEVRFHPKENTHSDACNGDQNTGSWYSDAFYTLSYPGYGISMDLSWIVKNGDRLLWIPPEFRSDEIAVAGSTVTICPDSGRLLIIRFSTDSEEATTSTIV